MEGIGGCGCQVFLQFVKDSRYDRHLANQLSLDLMLAAGLWFLDAGKSMAWGVFRYLLLIFQYIRYSSF